MRTSVVYLIAASLLLLPACNGSSAVATDHPPAVVLNGGMPPVAPTAGGTGAPPPAALVAIVPAAGLPTPPPVGSVPTAPPDLAVAAESPSPSQDSALIPNTDLTIDAPPPVSFWQQGLSIAPTPSPNMLLFGAITAFGSNTITIASEPLLTPSAVNPDVAYADVQSSLADPFGSKTFIIDANTVDAIPGGFAQLRTGQKVLIGTASAGSALHADLVAALPAPAVTTATQLRAPVASARTTATTASGTTRHKAVTYLTRCTPGPKPDGNVTQFQMNGLIGKQPWIATTLAGRVLHIAQPVGDLSLEIPWVDVTSGRISTFPMLVKDTSDDSYLEDQNEPLPVGLYNDSSRTQSSGCTTYSVALGGSVIVVFHYRLSILGKMVDWTSPQQRFGLESQTSTTRSFPAPGASITTDAIQCPTAGIDLPKELIAAILVEAGVGALAPAAPTITFSAGVCSRATVTNTGDLYGSVGVTYSDRTNPSPFSFGVDKDNRSAGNPFMVTPYSSNGMINPNVVDFAGVYFRASETQQYFVKTNVQASLSTGAVPVPGLPSASTPDAEIAMSPFTPPVSLFDPLKALPASNDTRVVTTTNQPQDVKITLFPRLKPMPQQFGYYLCVKSPQYAAAPPHAYEPGYGIFPTGCSGTTSTGDSRPYVQVPNASTTGGFAVIVSSSSAGYVNPITLTISETNFVGTITIDKTPVPVPLTGRHYPYSYCETQGIAIPLTQTSLKGPTGNITVGLTRDFDGYTECLFKVSDGTGQSVLVGVYGL